MKPEEIKAELDSLREQLRNLTKPITARISELMDQCEHQYSPWRDVDDDYGSMIRDCIICNDCDLRQPK